MGKPLHSVEVSVDKELLTFTFQDGSVAVFNSRKESKIQAWTIWTTQGEFKSVSTINEDIFFLVQRSIAGVTKLFFEQADPNYYTDCAIKVTNAPASASVTGLLPDGAWPWA